MNFDQLNKWLTPVANFGVIGGLVLVAVQMHFNTDAIRLQNALDNNRGIAEAEVALMDGSNAAEAWMAATLHPAELTESQLAQFWSYLHVLMLTTENTWLAYEDGLAPEQSWLRAKRGSVGVPEREESGGPRPKLSTTPNSSSRSTQKSQRTTPTR